MKKFFTIILSPLLPVYSFASARPSDDPRVSPYGEWCSPGSSPYGDTRGYQPTNLPTAYQPTNLLASPKTSNPPQCDSTSLPHGGWIPDASGRWMAFQRPIGQGSYATVHVGRNKKGSQIGGKKNVIIKNVDLEQVRTDSLYLLRELEVLEEARKRGNERIVRLLDVSIPVPGSGRSRQTLSLSSSKRPRSDSGQSNGGSEMLAGSQEPPKFGGVSDSEKNFLKKGSSIWIILEAADSDLDRLLSFKIKRGEREKSEYARYRSSSSGDVPFRGGATSSSDCVGFLPEESLGASPTWLGGSEPSSPTSSSAHWSKASYSRDEPAHLSSPRLNSAQNLNILEESDEFASTVLSDDEKLLFKLLTKEGFISLAKDLLEGLHFLHDTLLTMHRDVKPGNILLFKGEGKFSAKLCDFNLARLEVVEHPVTHAQRCRSPHVVTRRYRAPEIIRTYEAAKNKMVNPVEQNLLKQPSYCKKIDQFALGLSLYEALYMLGQYRALRVREKGAVVFDLVGMDLDDASSGGKTEDVKMEDWDDTKEDDVTPTPVNEIFLCLERDGKGRVRMKKGRRGWRSAAGEGGYDFFTESRGDPLLRGHLKSQIEAIEEFLGQGRDTGYQVV